MQCPNCGSGRRSDGYNREGWYWLECDRRFYPETHQYSPENNWCKLKQRDAEHETLNNINADLLEALKEIAEGRGRYSMDHLTHAMNTIEDMKQLATEAIRKAKEK